MSQPIRGQGSHLVFPIGPKNTNFLEDVEILLPVKFGWILFSGFRGEVENVSANQRPGRPSCFSDQPEKHKLGRGGWDLASCKVWLNSVQRFQRRSRKCEKLTTDGRTTDDGQRMITIVHLSLRLRCTKKKEKENKKKNKRKKNYFMHRTKFSLKVTHCYDVAKNATMASIGFSIQTVGACSQHLFNVTPYYSPCNKSCQKTRTLDRRQPSLNISQG